MTKAVKQIVFILMSFIAFFSCTNESETTDNEVNAEVIDSMASKNESAESAETTEKPKEVKLTTPKDYTAKYICPSRCPNSGSDKLGDCPECGMELIENPNSNKVIKKTN